MKHAKRVATAAAIAATGLFAGTAAAAPPQTYDQEIISQYSSANSVETIRHLAVDIGPRRSGTPEEFEGARYLAGVLESYGFESEVLSFPFTGTRNVAKVTSPNATLPNGPNWQMSASLDGTLTGVDSPLQGDVVYAGTGATPADFPANSAGKIVLMDQGANTAARSTQVANAVAAGAIAVVLGNTGTNAAPTTTITVTPNQSIPILGGGRAHLDWIKGLLSAGPLTLKLTTASYVNPNRAVVIGKRHAVGDPDGTKAPIVMVGAHIDSVLGAPGAHDDASGNGVAMEIARVVSKLPLDKEIWIGGFGGEEDGLTGSRAYVATLPAEERARFVGEWQMDMVGTPYAPAKLWALTPDGQTNFVVNEAYKAADRFGFTGLQNCRLGQSDHQAFFDVGIPSALFIWLDYRKPANGICGTTGGTYVTEPEYHRPTDGMANISPERLQTTLDVVGGAFAHNALNRVDITSAANTAVSGDCGDGARSFGTTDAAGKLLDIRVPHATCTFKAGDASSRIDVFGDRSISIAAGAAGGTVPATLSLTLGTAASFGAFTPGVTRTYSALTTANVISTAGDATLTVTDPSSTATGHLVNGAFSLPQPLNAAGSELPATVKTYTGPVSNDQAPVGFTQLVNSTDALRTGTYSKTLTFTLSTTTP